MLSKQATMKMACTAKGIEKYDASSTTTGWRQRSLSTTALSLVGLMVALYCGRSGTVLSSKNDLVLIQEGAVCDASLFGRPLLELQDEIQSRGYALTQVSNVVQALECLDLILPNDDAGHAFQPFFYSGGYFSRQILGSNPQHNPIYDVGPSNPNLTMAPHNEMGYGPRTPRFIAFGAQKAAPVGGHTTLLDGQRVYQELALKWQQAMQIRKIRYRVRFDGEDSTQKKKQTSWRKSFHGATSPLEAVQAARAMGYHQAHIFGNRTADETVLEDDGHNTINDNNSSSRSSRSIQTLFDAFAVVEHPITQKPCMFEQIVGAHGSALDQEDLESELPLSERLHHTTWAPPFEDNNNHGKESELEVAFLEDLAHLERKLVVQVPVPTNHILVVDNVWHKHGRAAFEGPREMLVAMRGAYRGNLQ